MCTELSLKSCKDLFFDLIGKGECESAVYFSQNTFNINNDEICNNGSPENVKSQTK